MTDAEKMLLSDALATAIQATKEARKWKKISIGALALAAVLFVCTIVR